MNHFAGKGGDPKDAYFAGKYFTEALEQNNGNTAATPSPIIMATQAPPLNVANANNNNANNDTNDANNELLHHQEGAECTECNEFAAIKRALTHISIVLDRTAIAGAVCARHGIPIPGCFFDILKGEGYEYADAAVKVLLEKYVQEAGLQKLIFFYDICCQYCVNFSQV